MMIKAKLLRERDSVGFCLLLLLLLGAFWEDEEKRPRER